MMTVPRSHLTGLIAAPHTPLDSDGEVNLDAIDPQAEMFARLKLTGAFVGGTTGEGMSLSVGERQSVAERWRQAAGEALKIIVHVGHTALPDARALAAHAAGIGADAIASIGPCFFRPSEPGPLVEWCRQIADAASELPFYYYHIPSMSGVRVPMFDLFQAAGDAVPTLAGAKFTHEDLVDFGRCVELDGGRFDMLFGRDEMLLAGLALGARGAVGTTYNYAAPLYQKLIDAFDAGDLAAARRLQEAVRRMVDVMVRFGGIAASKAMMGMIGCDCGPVRAPLVNLSDNGLKKLHGELERVGFFEFCSRC